MSCSIIYFYSYVKKWLDYSEVAMKARFKIVKEELEVKLNANKATLTGEMQKTNKKLLKKLKEWNKLVFQEGSIFSIFN